MHTIEAEMGAGVQLIPVLKCDAYGLGAVPIARALASQGGVSLFAVAQVGEAIALREAGILQDILVLSGVLQAHFAQAVAHGIHLCAHSVPMVRALGAQAARQGKQAKVQLKIDTGLNRLGPRPGEALSQLIDAVQAQPGLLVTGVYSHFRDGDTPGSASAHAQLALYKNALVQLEDAGIKAPLRHLSASGSSEWLPQANFDAVRIGRRLFMDSPHRPAGAIKEVASWRAEVVNVRTIAPGDTVGYGDAYTADTPMTIAVISVGYGDGLDERLGPARAPILVGAMGHRARYLSLCMDQSLLDVTGIPCRVGDEVTMFGYAAGGAFLSAQEVAGTFGQEGVYFTSRLGFRVEKRYVGLAK